MGDENKAVEQAAQKTREDREREAAGPMPGANAATTRTESTLGEAEIAALKQVNETLDIRVKTLDGALAKAVSGYRALVIEANPGIPSELITGDSVEAVGDSLTKAKALVDKVRQGIEARVVASRIPAGVPERGGAEQDLSAREKIERGISSSKR